MLAINSTCPKISLKMVLQIELKHIAKTITQYNLTKYKVVSDSIIYIYILYYILGCVDKSS